MSSYDAINFCANELMKSWFPSNYKNEDWLQSEDGTQWKEISILDATVVINAYEDYQKG